MASGEELHVKILEVGNSIREKKAAKAEKEEIMGLVEELKKLKDQFKSATGSEWVNPDQPPPSGDSKKKKKEGAGAGAEATQEKSKKQLEKEKKEAEKAAKKAEAEAKRQEEAKARAAAELASLNEDVLKRFGDAPLIQSQTISNKVWTKIKDLGPEQAGRKVLLRGSVHTMRVLPKGVFILLRQNIYSVQAVLWQGEMVPKAMVKYATGITRESIIDILGEIRIPSEPVQSATSKFIEIQVSEIHCISAADATLPFLVEDAARPESDDPDLPTVALDTRLNSRWMDTRTPANQAIFRIQSGVSNLFREFLIERGFIEIHTPKLLAGASEGGSSCFTLEYFNQPSCLAQSPQLHKQIACACAGFERVFEIGPVFRAEKHFTARHLCEFTGLDLEMAINEHYYEVLDLFSDLFIYIFDNLNSRFAAELEAINGQFPFEPLQYLRPSLRISFAEGVKLLQDAGFDASPEDDLDTEMEKALGKIIKEKYHTDFYIMDQYPMAIRPFYTMPHPDNPKVSNSYDMFIRGQEIVSGAQRIHDVNLLIEKIKGKPDMSLDSVQFYVDAFKHGALPHGGGGIGLERVVMLYLDLKNIRKTVLFPRDPKRLAP